MDQLLEPLACTINEASRISGEPRTKIYSWLKTGKLKSKKSGRRTLILYESLKQAIADLPDAKFTPPRSPPSPSPKQVRAAEELLAMAELESRS
jgi:excisionase family DNA binding protein